MKKFVLPALITLTISTAYAAPGDPTFILNPSEVTEGTTTTVSITFNQGTTRQGVGYVFNFDINLPAGVTFNNVTGSGGSVSCAALPAGATASDGTPAATGITVGLIGLSAIADGSVPCTFDIVAASGATGDITYTVQKEEYTFTDFTTDTTIETALAPTPVRAAMSGFNTTVNHSIDPAGTGTGTFTCDSGASGATVAGGTAVSCTAVPNGTDTSAISGCPAGATTSTDTTCAFTASSTANETVDLVAQFNTAGSGPGGPNNPTRPGNARPVPALGVFGLLAMLASMFGAATLVLRRKR